MSYAGPVSRAKRTPDVTPEKATTAAIGGAGRTGRTARAAMRAAAPRSASSSSDHRGAALFGAGVALGVVVGASIALLFAPESGADVRRKLSRRSRRLSRRGHDAWDDLREEFRHALKRRRLASLRQRDHADEPHADH